MDGENNPRWKGGVWKENAIRQRSEWKRRNPEKRRAHHAVDQEIKMGRMKRGQCSVCGSDRNIDAHHADYSKPLDVTWLCRSCHFLEHRSK